MRSVKSAFALLLTKVTKPTRLERGIYIRKTISGMIGKGSLNHNNRKFFAENVNSEKTQDNIVYCNENLKEVYHELFDDSLKKYNDKQTRKDRKIENYYEHIRQSKQEKLFHEVIFQIGNKDDMAVGTENGDLARTILDKFMADFQNRNQNLYVFAAHLHMDEATPHLHIDFVPFIENSKRGLEKRSSLKGALKAQSFDGGTRSQTEATQWINAEKEKLAEIMLEHGIEWEKLDTHKEHLSVLDFKKQERQKEVEDLGERVEQLKQSHVDLDSVDNIKASKVPLSNKVMIDEKDYKELKKSAQKYVVQEQTDGRLQKLLSAAYEKIRQLEVQLKELSGKVEDLLIAKILDKREIKNLKKENDRFKSFIEKQGLKDLYLNIFKKSKDKHDRDR